MRINNNLMAINTHRQLGVSQTEGAKSMEKLSSGLRINRAGDDAAGLAISEKMRGQIRGLSQASRNSMDTISLIQTAEGALSETHTILQRMRELATQSANDTNTASDRTEIQSEITQLIKELDRIGNTTEFNTKKLLDGSAVGISDAVKATAQFNGNSAVVVNTDALNKFQKDINDDTNFFMDGAHMLVRVNVSEFATTQPQIENDYKLIGPDGAEYSFVKGDSTSAVTVGKLADNFGNTILTVAQEITASVGTEIGVSITIADMIDDSGVVLGEGSILAVKSILDLTTTTSINVTVNNATVEIIKDSNGMISVGGVALADGASMTLKDGTVISRSGTEITVDQGFLTLAEAATIGTGAIKEIAANSVMSATSEFGANVTLEKGTVIGKADNTEYIRGSVTFNEETITFAGEHSLSADWSKMTTGLSNTFAFSKYAAGTNDLQNSFMTQAGANSGQILFVSMNDMRSAALGVDKIDISTRYGAATAMAKLDNAVQKVSHQRATLGAMQNRLESTIRNLDTAAENLQAAEARVRDVDMAKEIMTNTKHSILQQAAQAMLAQANQAPQSVLQLLR